MIKFFRAIRKKLLTENKFSKYLVYAVGEIILVTLGVLLAIRFNNLNEEQKNKAHLDVIYERVLLDIDNNINVAKELIAEYKDMDYLYKSVLNDSISPNLLGQGLENLTVGYILYEYDKTGVDQLKSQEGLDSTAIKIIRIYDNAQRHISASENIITADISNNLQDWKNNHAWFRQYVNYELNKEAQVYFLTSQDFKNKVSYSYLCVYQSYIPSIQDFIFELKEWKERFNENKKYARQ